MKNVAEFISNYTEEDEYYIFFDWNDQRGAGFDDANAPYRKVILQAVLEEPGTAGILLIRDLYRAETQYAREAWGVDQRLGTLAQLLLTQGGEEFVEDYLQGKLQGMDTWCGASDFPYTPELGRRMLAEVERRLSASPDERRRELLEVGVKVFTSWVEAGK